MWLAEQLEQLFSSVNFKLYLWDLVSFSGENKKNVLMPLGKNIPLTNKKVHNTQDGTVSLVKMPIFHK